MKHYTDHIIAKNKTCERPYYKNVRTSRLLFCKSLHGSKHWNSWSWERAYYSFVSHYTSHFHLTHVIIFVNVTITSIVNLRTSKYDAEKSGRVSRGSAFVVLTQFQEEVSIFVSVMSRYFSVQNEINLQYRSFKAEGRELSVRCDGERICETSRQ